MIFGLLSCQLIITNLTNNYTAQHHPRIKIVNDENLDKPATGDRAKITNLNTDIEFVISEVVKIANTQRTWYSGNVFVIGPFSGAQVDLVSNLLCSLVKVDYEIGEGMVGNGNIGGGINGKSRINGLPVILLGVDVVAADWAVKKGWRNVM
ncbi:hypothetical protein HDU76_009788 [Blyttiomyces sp. JEL0837]|nr:hypothetical protein HDU76_009788 [Blyttiomyces sp. JEL0837]